MGLALMNMINYNLSNGILHVYVTPPIQHTKTHQICTDHINGIAKLCYLIKDAQSDHYASKYFCVWLTHQWLLPIYTSHFCILLNISVKYLWKYSTLNMQKSYFRAPKILSIGNKGFSYSLESQKMTYIWLLK